MDIFWLVVGGGGYILTGEGRWWMVVDGGGGWRWMVVGRGGWWHSLI